MKIEHIAIVYKKSVYQKQVLEAKTTQPISKLIEDNHPSVRKILPSHHKHLECLEYVQDFLTKEKIEFSLFQRNQNFDESTFDLILSVGGDGTFLDASKNVSEKYMLGVNSCPNDSVGRFSAAYKENFSDFIRDIISDQIKPTVLTRLSVRLQGKTLIPALNDVLVTNRNPASTSRYLFSLDQVEEEHRSSGIWISTAAGSTAAISGAGGVNLPLDSTDYQFVVREPYEYKNIQMKLKKKVLSPEKCLKITSKMRRGSVYIDGSSHRYSFRFGQELAIDALAPTLKVYGL